MKTIKEFKSDNWSDKLICDFLIGRSNLNLEERVFLSEYLFRLEKLVKKNVDLGNVSDWVSPNEKLPEQHQKIEVLGEGVYYVENDKVVMNTGEWYVNIEDFKEWRPSNQLLWLAKD